VLAGFALIKGVKRINTVVVRNSLQEQVEREREE